MASRTSVSFQPPFAGEMQVVFAYHIDDGLQARTLRIGVMR